MTYDQLIALKHLREVVDNRNRSMRENAQAVKDAQWECYLAGVPHEQTLKITEGREAKR